VGPDRYRLGRVPDVTRWRAGRRIELILAGLVDDSGYPVGREAVGDGATRPGPSGPRPAHQDTSIPVLSDTSEPGEPTGA